MQQLEAKINGASSSYEETVPSSALSTGTEYPTTAPFAPATLPEPQPEVEWLPFFPIGTPFTSIREPANGQVLEDDIKDGYRPVVSREVIDEMLGAWDPSGTLPPETSLYLYAFSPLFNSVARTSYCDVLTWFILQYTTVSSLSLPLQLLRRPEHISKSCKPSSK